MTGWSYQISLNSLRCYNRTLKYVTQFLHLPAHILSQLRGDISSGKTTAESLQQQHNNPKLVWWLRFVYLPTKRLSRWNTVKHTQPGPLWQIVLDFSAWQARRREREKLLSEMEVAEEEVNAKEKFDSEWDFLKEHGDGDRNMKFSYVWVSAETHTWMQTHTHTHK